MNSVFNKEIYPDTGAIPGVSGGPCGLGASLASPGATGRPRGHGTCPRKVP